MVVKMCWFRHSRRAVRLACSTWTLLGLARLYILRMNAFFLHPYLQRRTDVFRAVVDPNVVILVAPFDDTFRRGYNA